MSGKHKRADTVGCFRVVQSLQKRKYKVKELAEKFDVGRDQIYSDLNIIKRFCNLKKEYTNVSSIINRRVIQRTPLV